MVYALHIDRLEQRCLAARSAGADVDPEQERHRFDEWLTAMPAAVADPEDWELRRALGLRN